MAIRQRGSSWQADVTHKGKRHRATFPTKEDAEAWVMEAKAALLRGEPFPCPDGFASGSASKARPSQRKGQGRGKGSMTLEQACERALHRYWVGTPSERMHTLHFNALYRHFGANAPVSSIDTHAVDLFIEALQKAGNSNGTVNRKLATLSKVLRYCLDRGHIQAMPKIERKREGQGRIRFLTPAEEQTILSLMRQWGKDDHAEAVEVLIDTGFRNSELWALQGRDVDLKQGLIHVWRTKTDHPRSVYMTDRVQAILERRKELHGDGVLFPGMDNYTLRYVWDRARTQMGLDNDPNFVPYVCRHTCASRMVQRNVPIPVIKQWMGHKTVQMTMRYAHLAPTNLKAAAAALNQ